MDNETPDGFQVIYGTIATELGLARWKLPNGVRLECPIPAGMEDAIAYAEVDVRVKDFTSTVRHVQVIRLYVGSQRIGWRKLDPSQVWLSL